MKTLILDIKKMGINGEGIGHLLKKPVFVDKALLFERVKVNNIREFPNFFRADLEQVITSSEHRLKPVCDIAQECGACSLMHADLKLQQDIKIENIKQSLFKYAKIKNPVISFHPNPNPLKYRNQCKFILGIDNGKIASGMFKKDSNQWLGIDYCIIHNPILEQVRREVTELLNKHHVTIAFKANESGYRYLVIRVLENKAQVTLISTESIHDESLLTNISKIKHVESVYTSVNNQKTREFFGDKVNHGKGNEYLNVVLDTLSLQLSPQSFMQLNSEVSSNMMKLVLSKIKPTDAIVEAYCGVGMMSLLASKKAKVGFAFDLNKQAIVDGRKHAQLNNITNIHFKAMDADVGILEANKRFKKYTLIVDPPRSGLSDKFISSCMKANINQLIYVSCNPSTLAKNLRTLLNKFTIKSIDAFDMFSHTQHVECVVLMSRVED